MAYCIRWKNQNGEAGTKCAFKTESLSCGN